MKKNLLLSIIPAILLLIISMYPFVIKSFGDEQVFDVVFTNYSLEYQNNLEAYIDKAFEKKDLGINNKADFYYQDMYFMITGDDIKVNDKYFKGSVKGYISNKPYYDYKPEQDASEFEPVVFIKMGKLNEFDEETLLDQKNTYRITVKVFLGIAYLQKIE
jgi:hypothetical protein